MLQILLKLLSDNSVRVWMNVHQNERTRILKLKLKRMYYLYATPSHPFFSLNREALIVGFIRKHYNRPTSYLYSVPNKATCVWSAAAHRQQQCKAWISEPLNTKQTRAGQSISVIQSCVITYIIAIFITRLLYNISITYLFIVKSNCFPQKLLKYRVFQIQILQFTKIREIISSKIWEIFHRLY